MVRIDFGYNLFAGDTEFSVVNDDFGHLEIRTAGDKGFHYFYDSRRHRLVTDFVLDDRPLVATLCQVTLIKKNNKYSPRLRFWKKDKTKAKKPPVENTVATTPTTKVIKALVDTSDCHEAVWRLIHFLQSFADVETTIDDFRVLEGSAASLAQALAEHSRDTVLNAVKSAIGGTLTDADIALLTNRREQLVLFERLLTDDDFFEDQRAQYGSVGNERVWQEFFEANQWIFGYGLNLISCQSLSEKRLEQITTGANIFSGAGKRSDGVLRTKGYISSLLFAEIKTHKKDLLKASPYRPPDVYQVSDEVSGGLSQVQKTAEKAVRRIATQFHSVYDSDGTPTGIEVSTTRPRMVVIVGQLNEFNTSHGVNREKSSSFELYRRDIKDVEIITFDELFERARFIVTNE